MAGEKRKRKPLNAIQKLLKAARDRAYREAHRDEINARRRKRYREKKLKAERDKRYREAHRDEINARRRERYRQKKEEARERDNRLTQAAIRARLAHWFFATEHNWEDSETRPNTFWQKSEFVDLSPEERFWKTIFAQIDAGVDIGDIEVALEMQADATTSYVQGDGGTQGRRNMSLMRNMRNEPGVQALFWYHGAIYS